MFRLKWSQSEIASLLILLVLVVCILLVKIQGSTTVYIVLVGVSILVLNIVSIFRDRVESSNLIGIYTGYILFTSVLRLLGFLGVSADYLVDLTCVVLLLLILTVYHYNTGLREVFAVYIPVVVLVSVITGIYLGIADPLGYAILALVDTFSAIIVLSSTKNHVAGFLISLLLFTLLYSAPTLVLSTPVFSALLIVYILKTLLVLYNKKRSLRLTVSLDLLLRPLVVSYL